MDKLSSAHVYLRMPDDLAWESIPEALLADCAQLVKANSIEGTFANYPAYDCSSFRNLGNKKDNLTIIYTPGDNLKVGPLPAAWNEDFPLDPVVENGRYGCWPGFIP